MKRKQHKRSLKSTLCAAVTALAVAGMVAPVAQADPPPWAPAHGWRAKHEHKHSHQEVRYVDRVDGNFFRCNSEAIGAAIGAVAGGALGSTVKGDGRPVAIIGGAIGGAIIGAIIGGQLGRDIDRVDRACTVQGLTRLKDGQTIRWENPNTRHSYALRPVSTYSTDGGRTCRRYVIHATKQDERYERTACRGDDEVWHIPS